MIIKGDPAGSVAYWSKHLLRDDTNEKAEIREISGLSATDLLGALREMQAVASGSRSEGNFMYQANINPLAHEHLTPEQWKEAIDTLERNLGLEGHQRVVVEHIKEGRQHYHVIWNRVDIETMKVADMGGNYRIHTDTARALEAKFNLRPTPTPSPGERTHRDELWEERAAERSGIDIKAMREEVTKIWNSTSTGAEFKSAIEKHGYILARGDRRDFCLVDRAGDAHSLARRLDGPKTADVRERMSDVSRDDLPTVQEARETQRSTPPREIEPRDQRHGLDSAELNDRSALKVMDAATGTVEKLGDFLADFLTGPSPTPKRDPHTEQVERILADRRALSALQRIRDDIESGKNLRGEDLRDLTAGHLSNLRAKGDSYLRELVRQMEDERERDRDRGRQRER
jgi:hypothetical protein